MIAGQAWSADPHTGRRDRVRISAGGADVLVQSGIGRALVVNRSGPCALDDERCLTLARLVMRLEWAVGEGQDPQTVDWSFDGQRFTLGEPRLIDHLPRVTVPIARSAPALWSNANLKDAIAGVPTTASWSFIAPYLRAILFAPIERLDFPVPPGMEVVRRFEGRAYLDLTSVQATYFGALGALPANVNAALGGVSAEINLPAPNRAQERRWWVARLRLLWQMVRHLQVYARDIDAVQRSARRLPLDFRGYSNAQLIELAEQIADQQSAFGSAFQTGNFEAGTWPALLEGLLERCLAGEGRRVAAGLMAGSGQVTSAEHGVRLVELARIADSDAAALNMLVNDDARDWRDLPADSSFRMAFARFLDEFGHRGVYEAELANPRWIEDPRFLLDQVGRYVDEGLPTLRSSDQRRLAEQALRRMPMWPRVLAMWLASRARRSAALREAGKSALVAMALPVRLLLLEFGRRLVAVGLIDAIDDVFHLSRADLETFGRGEWDGRDFRALATERRRVREARLARPAPPDLIGSTVFAAAPGQLRGLAASPGVGCGPARLIRHPSEGVRLQRGDVLVATSTDPGWTPLFLRCAAVVTEAGGLLSHGAIVARELGLPAVVNVAGVFDALTDGDEVCVDGNRGVVEPHAR